MNSKYFVGRTAGKKETTSRKGGVEDNDNNNNNKKKDREEMMTMMTTINEDRVEKKDEMKIIMSKSAQPSKPMTVAVSTAKRGGEREVGELMVRKSR